MSIQQEVTGQGSVSAEQPAAATPTTAPGATGAGPSRRIFRVVDGAQSTDYEDPLPGAPDEKVIGVLKTQIARLTGATQESKVEGDTRVVTLTVRTGTKG